MFRESNHPESQVKENEKDEEGGGDDDDNQVVVVVADDSVDEGEEGKMRDEDERDDVDERMDEELQSLVEVGIRFLLDLRDDCCYS